MRTLQVAGGVMAHEFEDVLRDWSKPPSTTEDERCANAEGVVRNAIRAYTGFAGKTIEVFAQGSYRNGTNVRTESDVCVRCMNPFFTDYPTGGKIVNWPHQNYENGTAKNKATGTRFKNLVRVLKRLRYLCGARRYEARFTKPLR